MSLPLSCSLLRSLRACCAVTAVTVVGLGGLAACTDPSSLPTADRAKFTKEIIDQRPECQTFVQQLAAASSAPDAVQGIYQAAKAAHCLRPNV